jgi:hypothetical protein
MQITSLEQLQSIKQTEIIELPAFEDGTKLNVEVKKPNMMQLIAAGKIPNTLLNSAMEMFNGKAGEKMQKAADNAGDLKDLVGMMNVIAEASLVNPTYKQIKELGIDLTDNQLMGLLMYSQGG